jgi:hypothetical protein
LDQVAAGVVQDRRDHVAHRGRGLNEPDAVLFEFAVCGSDVVHREGGVRDAVGDQRILEGLRGRVLVRLEKQLDAVSGLGLGNRETKPSRLV